MGRIAASAVALAILTCTATAAATPRASLFDYDRAAPLHLAVAKAVTSQGALRQDVRFDAGSVRLKAYYVHPRSGGPWPLVVWTPGNGGDRREELPDAYALARVGIASLLVDPPNGELVRCQADEDLGVYVRYVVSRRRAVDVAERLPNVDPKRVAAAGFSFGASVTGTLAGVEHRFTAFVVESGRGHHTGFMRKVCESLSKRAFTAYARKLGVVDPVRWVPEAGPSAMLIQHGTRDPWSTKADVRALYAAARRPKELRTYRAGHELNRAALRDRVAWLRRQLRGG